jgi:hypothetical protein
MWTSMKNKLTKSLMIEQTVEILFDLGAVTAEFLHSDPMPTAPYKYQLAALNNCPSSNGHIYLWFI